MLCVDGCIIVDCKMLETPERVTGLKWVEKLKYMCFMNKFTVILTFRKRKLDALRVFSAEWNCSSNSKYNAVSQDIRKEMLSIL